MWPSLWPKINIYSPGHALCRQSKGPRSLAGRGLWSVSTRRALGRIRTCNLLIRSQVLYPLSYERSPKQYATPASVALYRQVLLIRGPTNEATSSTNDPPRVSHTPGPTEWKCPSKYVYTAYA